MYNCMAGASCQKGRYNGDDADAGPGGRLALGEGGPDGLTMKERTKNKRKLDQSASFLGGRWKTEEEMHMRDNFDS